jgi:CheY-like chemotaxis protein
MNILVAEDYRACQETIKFLMDDWGYMSDIVFNGREAVEKTRKSQYDLCLMDIDMPVMGGYEATKIIRRQLRYLPIMALTANPAFEKKRCLEVGMDDFLEKPFDHDELRQKIVELTVKAVKIQNVHNRIEIRKEMPMDAEHLKELRELDKKGLGLLVIEAGKQRFVVHKNIQNKMSHVLIGEGKELFEFLDRGEQLANCHLYKCNMQTNKLLLTPEQFEERLKKEDRDIENYTCKIDQKFSAEKKGKK